MPADEDTIYRTPAGDFTLAQLRERVEVPAPGIVLFRELAGGDRGNFMKMIELVKERGEPMGDFVVIIDLADATRPGPGLLEYLFEAMRTVGIHWCAVQTGNRIMRHVVQFVIRRATKGSSTTVHNSRQEAIDTAKTILAARSAN